MKRVLTVLLLAGLVHCARKKVNFDLAAHPPNIAFAPGDAEPCPQNFNPPSGTINSPNFPQPYDNNLFCDIILHLHNPQRIWKEIRVKVNAFDTELKHDYFILNGIEYSGNGTGSKVDNTALVVGLTYKFRSNFAWFHMRFVTDGSVTSKGFSLDYSVFDSQESHNITEVCQGYWPGQKPCGDNGTCHSHVEGFYCVCKRGFTGERCQNRINLGNCPRSYDPPSGQIQSFQYPSNYPDDFDCLMTINIQEFFVGNPVWRDVRITVEEFITEACCDSLTINNRDYAGNGTLGTRVTYRRDTNAMMRGQTYYFRSNVIYFTLRFVTDDSISRKGFSLRYTVARSSDQSSTVTESCMSNPCQNGATCHSLQAGPKCVCAAQYTGQFCENRLDTRGCPVRYRTIRTTFQSTNYPRPYPSNLQCSYIFDLSIYNRYPWKQIRLYSWYFETEKNRDYLFFPTPGYNLTGVGYYDTTAAENRKWYYIYTQDRTFTLTFNTRWVSGATRHPGWAFNYYLYGRQQPPPSDIIADALYADHDDDSIPEDTNTVEFDEDTQELIEYPGESLEEPVTEEQLDEPESDTKILPPSRTCPKYLYPPRGRIMSPNYPRSYSNMEFCDVILQLRNPQKIWKEINIVVEEFQTEFKHDILIVNGREYSGNGSVGGDSKALQVGRRYRFRTNYVWFHIRFRTDGSVVKKGFSLTYTVTNSRERHNITEFCEPNPCMNGDCHSFVEGFYCTCNPGWTGSDCSMVIIRPATCPKMYNAPSGTMQSDNYPQPYPNNIDCDMRLSLNNPSRTWKDIIITVDEFKTEGCCDKLTINGREYGGDGSMSRRLEPAALQKAQSYLFRSRDTTFNMNFKADGSVSFIGFSLRYQVRDSTNPDGMTEACMNNPCQNAGVCHSFLPGVKCFCTSKFTGDNCEREKETFNCPHYFFEPAGIIESPNWPLPYPNTVHCNYYINVEGIGRPYKKLVIYVAYFETEKDEDILNIQGRNYSGIGYFDDTSLRNLQSYEFYTSDKQFSLNFRAQYSRRKHPGFKLQYLVQSTDSTPPVTGATGAATTTPSRWQPTTDRQRGTKPPPKKGGLSGGGIAGIVIAVLIVVVVAAAVGFLFMRKRGYIKGMEGAMKPGFANALYGQKADDVNFSNT